MQNVVFVTGNPVKFRLGERVCLANGFELNQKELDITEIQSLDGNAVARHKAEQAYKILQKPIIITDDTWLIPGLNGFPGTYMQAINTWFSSEDWLRLTKPLKDRRSILRQILVYQDAKQQKLFSRDIEGRLLKEIHGASAEYPVLAVVAFDDSGKSSAEQLALRKPFPLLDETVWDDFAPWYKARMAKN